MRQVIEQWVSHLRQGLIASLLAGAAIVQAMPVTVGLSGSGQAAPTGQVNANGAFEVVVLASSYTVIVGDITQPPWQLSSLFWVEPGVGGLPGNSHGSGRFFDPAGSDAIDFSFDGLFEGLIDGALEYRLTYEVTGGSGFFAGARGGGFETVRIADDFSFTGAGRLLLTVPEPAGAALALLALLALAAASRRRILLPQGDGIQLDSDSGRPGVRTVHRRLSAVR